MDYSVDNVATRVFIRERRKIMVNSRRKGDGNMR